MVIKVKSTGLDKADIHKIVVGVLCLSQESPLHRNYTMAQWFRRIVRSIELNQFSYYESENGRPLAFCNWAFLSEANKNEILIEGRQITNSDWQSGEHIFVPEFIAPYGQVQEVIDDLRNRVMKSYQGQQVSTFRVRIDAKNKKISRSVQSFVI